MLSLLVLLVASSVAELQPYHVLSKYSDENCLNVIGSSSLLLNASCTPGHVIMPCSNRTTLVCAAEPVVAGPWYAIFHNPNCSARAFMVSSAAEKACYPIPPISLRLECLPGGAGINVSTYLEDTMCSESVVTFAYSSTCASYQSTSVSGSCGAYPGEKAKRSQQTVTNSNAEWEIRKVSQLIEQFTLAQLKVMKN